MGFNSGFKGLIKVEFSRHIFEKYVSNYTKIRPVGARMFHAGGWTDGRTAGQT